LLTVWNNFSDINGASETVRLAAPMTRISIVAASRERLAALSAALPGDVTAEPLRLEDLPHSKPANAIIFDIDLGRAAEVQAAKAWLSGRSQHGPVIVCVDGGLSHLRLTQAYALGATAVLSHPLQTARIHRLLNNVSETPLPSQRRRSDDPTPELDAIADLFAAGRSGQSPSLDLTTRCGAQIVDRLRDIGLSDYLAAIQSHHSRTYTHCLTVTAVAVGFGIQLGLGRADSERLSVAGLLHDIGKSQIPLDILEKPGALNDQESEIMRNHPLLGYEMLRGTAELSDDIHDMVLHHHEYLDGTGYPHGLQGSQISDMNRIMTIADVFGALVEPRSYKPPMSGEQALDILRAMGPKLDGALVRAFTLVAAKLAA
jgi:putative nucleotidyltransferase with HDIG domain